MTIYKPGRRRGARRMSDAQRAVLALLRNHASRRLTYDQMAIATEYDRRTLITAVQGLEAAQRISIERGTGRLPNRYDLL